MRDIETINNELCKKDIIFVKAAQFSEKEQVRKSGGKYKLSPIFNDTIDKMLDMLERNIPIRNGEWTTEEGIFY